MLGQRGLRGRQSDERGEGALTHISRHGAGGRRGGAGRSSSGFRRRWRGRGASQGEELSQRGLLREKRGEGALAHMSEHRAGGRSGGAGRSSFGFNRRHAGDGRKASQGKELGQRSRRGQLREEFEGAVARLHTLAAGMARARGREAGKYRRLQLVSTRAWGQGDKSEGRMAQQAGGRRASS